MKKRLGLVRLACTGTYAEDSFSGEDFRRFRFLLGRPQGSSRSIARVPWHFVVLRDGSCYELRPVAHPLLLRGALESYDTICIAYAGGCVRSGGQDRGVDTRTEDQKVGMRALISMLGPPWDNAPLVGESEVVPVWSPCFDVGVEFPKRVPLPVGHAPGVWPGRRVVQYRLSFGDYGLLVGRLQGALRAGGFLQGTRGVVNMVFDERTRDAVLAFQRSAGLPVDGVVGVATAMHLVAHAEAFSRLIDPPAGPDMPSSAIRKPLEAGSRGGPVGG